MIYIYRIEVDWTCQVQNAAQMEVMVFMFKQSDSLTTLQSMYV
jgi:hypothetical protein